MSVVLVPGEQFGRYVIEAELGRGGQAVVYRAHQDGPERAVALKVFDEIEDAAKLARFRREAVAAARVEHPRIVTVYESGDVGGVPFLAMRLVPGPSLAEVLSRFGALPPRRALAILSDVAEAVDAAHAHGLVHRDIKPANVLLDLDERAFLSDFGVARLEDLPRLTRRGDWLGTVEYVSPEQAEGRPATPASDVYAFGVLAYEVLTGRPPFVHRQQSAVLVAHVRDRAPSVRTVNPALPAGVDAVLARALAKDPSVRPGSARRLVAELRGVLDAGGPGPGDTAVLPGAAAPDAWTAVLRRFSTGDGTPGPTRVLPAGGRRRRRRGRVALAGLVVLLAAGAAGAGGWVAHDRSADGDGERIRETAYRQGFGNGVARGTARGRTAGLAEGRRAGRE
ncbi:MAG TPA: protein kinase, partial [Miltoncostaeaceae bacterium]|nr:protein kinase [Miltoncostaeaceae bacterium]